MKRTLVTGLVGFGISLLACSGSTANGDGATMDSACNTFIDALCSKLDACAPLVTRVQYKDVAECKARQKQTCLKAFLAPGTGATPSAVNACGSAYSGLSCDDIFAGSTPPACRIAGTLADGAPCGEATQCAGAACRKTGSNTCGACSTRGASGAACTSNTDCAYELTCAEGKCIARSKAGAACSDAQPCEGNLHCKDGTCAVALEAGAACTPTEGECNSAKGLTCDGTAKVCKEVKLANAGEPCGIVDDAFVVCAAAGKCKLVAGGAGKGVCEVAAADGQPCNTQTGPNCIEPAECTNGVCTITDPSSCK